MPSTSTVEGITHMGGQPVRPRMRIIGVGLCATALVLAGCGGQASQTSSDGGATSVASPSAVASSGTPSPSASASTAAPTVSPSNQQLYDEAVQVLQQANDLQNKIEHQGGFPAGVNPPRELGEVMMAGAYEAQVKYFNNMFKAKGRAVQGSADISRLQAAVPNRPGALVALRYCVDAGAVTYKQQDGKSFKGTVRLVTSYFGRDANGKLKWMIWNGREVKSCDS